MGEIKKTLQAKLKTGCMMDRSERETSHHANVSDEEYNYSQLAFAIVTQAVEDYKLAKQNGKSTKEVESFFEGDWCDALLRLMPLNGREILDYLSKEFG